MKNNATKQPSWLEYIMVPVIMLSGFIGFGSAVTGIIAIVSAMAGFEAGMEAFQVCSVTLATTTWFDIGLGLLALGCMLMATPYFCSETRKEGNTWSTSRFTSFSSGIFGGSTVQDLCQEGPGAGEDGDATIEIEEIKELDDGGLSSKSPAGEAPDV